MPNAEKKKERIFPKSFSLCSVTIFAILILMLFIAITHHLKVCSY